MAESSMPVGAIDIDPPASDSCTTSASDTAAAVAAAMASVAAASAVLGTASSALSTFASGLSLERKWPPLLSTAAAESTEALLVCAFLSEIDVLRLFEVATKRANDVTYSPEHIALNLHRDDYLAVTCPELLCRITAGMHTRARAPGFSVVAEDVPLNVRCVEFHTYTVGGNVMMAGHRDWGSVFTLCVLLSDPSDFDGGELMTWHAGEAQIHAMGRGDALFFHSEKVHNVATVTRGVRHSLVVELWQGASNRKDRYS